LLLVTLGKNTYHWSNLSYIEYIKNSINFIPFKTIYTYIQSAVNNTMNISIILQNIIFPIILFVPMGILSLINENHFKKTTHIVCCSLAISTVIEVLQLVLRRGVFDIDDILLNLLGTVLGIVIFSLIKNIIFSIKKNSGAINI
ncbi:MAG: VanZ family protein, partial [Oscillospiraceae bacterium]